MSERIVTVLAADDRFSRPLAVTIQSIIEHLTPGREMDMYLCDMGISPEHRKMIDKVAAHPRVNAQWVTTLKEKVEHLPESWPGITRATYARLFIPEILPPEVAKALYLDCDLVIRRCIGDLFDTPMDNFAAMAVADACSPYVSSPLGLPFWARAGRRADDVNFNAGVLLMDLAAWRAENLAEAAFGYLTSGQHQFMGDQEAINAVLPGRIGVVDPRWNQQTEHFILRYAATLPYNDELVRQLTKDPWIIHYTTNMKAWTFGCKHAFREDWFAALDKTPFRGWRPTRSAHLTARGGRLLKGVKKRLVPSS
jgi:lipopolysaccharide biosynthesis glycosyltransferase